MCTRDFDDGVASFGTTGYTNDRVFVLYDRNTESVWHPLSDGSLDAISGEKKGAKISFLRKPQPQSLGSWLDKHPDSWILLPPPRPEVPPRNRAVLGVQLETQAARIMQVVDDSGAARGGLRAGDLVVAIASSKFANRSIGSRIDLVEALSLLEPGDVVQMGVERGGATITVEVTLGERPGTRAETKPKPKPKRRF